MLVGVVVDAVVVFVVDAVVGVGAVVAVAVSTLSNQLL